MSTSSVSTAPKVAARAIFGDGDRSVDAVDRLRRGEDQRHLEAVQKRPKGPVDLSGVLARADLCPSEPWRRRIGARSTIEDLPAAPATSDGRSSTLIAAGSRSGVT